MPAEEGAAWTVLHPRFNLGTPAPVLVVPFGFAAAHGEREMQAFLDAWVGTVRGAGIIDRLYSYWMLGETAETREPRWSVVRDVLGWIE